MDPEAIASVMVLAPTVKAAATRAGEKLPASVASFPAETVTNTPLLMAALTALSRVVLALPPIDRLMIDGRLVVCAWLTTQLMPAMIPEVVPEPESLSTLTAMTCAFLATPYTSPTAVHAM